MDVANPSARLPDREAASSGSQRLAGTVVFSVRGIVHAWNRYLASQQRHDSNEGGGENADHRVSRAKTCREAAWVTLSVRSMIKFPTRGGAWVSSRSYAAKNLSYQSQRFRTSSRTQREYHDRLRWESRYATRRRTFRNTSTSATSRVRCPATIHSASDRPVTVSPRPAGRSTP